MSVFRINYKWMSWSLPLDRDEHILWEAEKVSDIDYEQVKTIIETDENTYYTYLTTKELTNNEVLVEKLNGYTTIHKNS